MLERVHIQNFKSILDEEIELGSFNVFIGQNGCGKTNVLEAVGMLAGAIAQRLSLEDLFARGVRIARPSLMVSGFAGGVHRAEIVVSGALDGMEFRAALKPSDPSAHGGSWTSDGLGLSGAAEEGVLRFVGLERLGTDDAPTRQGLLAWALARSSGLPAYAIFAPATNTLRGLDVSSRREPLGLYGENLDVTLARFPKEDLDRLRHHLQLIDWVDDLHVDEGDRRKFEGLKLGRSQSRLYFTDRFMDADNRTFSAENANEGVLHVLFHLALFLSKNTPEVFAIDNLETALNPGMCRRLSKALAELAVERNKQALVTTHNPAILDGLNLHDDRQRLFVVYRNDDGHTKVKRVKTKPESAPGLKLSELWLRGHLGTLPADF